jgi:hypothetical protein
MCTHASYAYPAYEDTEEWRKRTSSLPADVLDEIRQHAMTPCPTCGARGVAQSWAVVAVQTLMDRADYVTRVEVIGPDGREYTRYGAIVDMAFQDGNRTLKIFVSGDDAPPVTAS